MLVGSSTGGPKALTRLLQDLTPPLPVPILVVQHMPGQFLEQLANRLAAVTGHDVRLAEQGERVGPGVRIAPGDRHLTLRGRATSARIALVASPPENYCRPAADPLMRSAAAVYGAATLGVVLTGMGADATEGSRAVVAAGGRVLVQDRATSAVWGMPGAVVREGLAAATVPIEELGGRVQELCAVVASDH